MCYKDKDLIIVIAKEAWGNTDFVNLAQQASLNNYETFFIGLGKKDGLEYYPDREFTYTKRGKQIGFGFLNFAISTVKMLEKQFSGRKLFIHVRYFKGCSLIPFVTKQTMVLDVRSASIKPNKVIRFTENSLIKIEAIHFSEVSVISNGVATKVLGLKKYSILPLGASLPKALSGKTDFSSHKDLKFVYVGVLTGRKIDLFCEAFGDFVDKNGLNWTFDIYGYGKKNDIVKIERLSNRWNFIKWNGALLRQRFYQTLSDYDIGVSYVPITPYYNHQPPTKTFEYLVAGLQVLATCTDANKEILNESMGWLTGEDKESINKSLETLLRTKGDSPLSEKQLEKFSWTYIFDNHYLPIIIRQL